MRPFAIVLALALAAQSARSADACAPAYPMEASVRIADESAILVWDEATRTEHFIRRATFTTTATDFGFLVPTPTRPELAEAPDHVFGALEAMIKPEIIYRTKIDGIQPGLLCAAPFYFTLRSASGPQSAPAAAPVRVLETKRVAGYDAAVLEADSAGALAEWLKTNGYVSRPALEEWLKPYIEMRWIITAYKIAGGSDAKAVETSAVRMSFKTDKPFFPYREPSDQRETIPAKTGAAIAEPPPARVLRVFFIGPRRVSGAIGGDEEARAWPAETVWAGTFAAATLSPALAPLPLPFAEAWLTALEDRSNPRPGTDDVFFSPSVSPEPVRPPPIEVIRREDLFLPLDLVALLIGVPIWLVKRRRKNRRDAPPAAQ
jgi:hypothetical protein